MSNQSKWYVIHTYSGYENKVMDDLRKIVESRNLEDYFQEIRVPTEKVTQTKDNQTRVTERKTFPGYVLVKMILTDDTWYVVRNIRGCTGFVGSPDSPIPLTEEEVAKMGVETLLTDVDYSVGDTVNVVSGTLQGFTGIVDSIDLENNSVRIIVSMFGRETPADVKLDQVELAE